MGGSYNQPSVGDQFNRLSYISEGGFNGKYRMWSMKCTCGNSITVRSSKVLEGSVKSCGCLRKELNVKHGKHMGKISAEKNRLPKGIAATNAKYYYYVYSANKRCIVFDLTLEQFIGIVSKNCTYCGRSPQQIATVSRYTNGELKYNGIDRVDSSIGYVINNCVPCCKVCNYAKSNTSLEEFTEWIDKVYHHYVQPRKNEVRS